MRVEIDLARQRLSVFDETEALTRSYPVSTAANGPGERAGSGCTPRGRHLIRARIGAGAPRGAVFKGRRPTGEIWSPAYAQKQPGRDWILSRILWLSGCEPGRNRLGEVDTMRRYIYIHGTPDDQPMGVPLSHGCVRMRNDDVIALFDLLPAGTPVDIVEGSAPGEGAAGVEGGRVVVDIDMLDWQAAEAAAMPVREAVFVVEQGVPMALERDQYDAVSRHALARLADGTVVATGRLLPDGHIGRMAVTRAFRGSDVGGRVLAALIAEARARGLAEVVLNAQVQALAFYRRHGFAEVGEVFMEAGLPHREMRRTLSSQP